MRRGASLIDIAKQAIKKVTILHPKFSRKASRQAGKSFTLHNDARLTVGSFCTPINHGRPPDAHNDDDDDDDKDSHSRKKTF